MEIVMHNCQIQIATNPDGIKLMMLIDPESKIKIVVPLVPEAAVKIGHALAGIGIVVPQFIPPTDVLKRNGGVT